MGIIASQHATFDSENAAAEERIASSALRAEDEIARYYWPNHMGEPAPWFRAAISDAYDTGIAFAVRRDSKQNTEGGS